MKSSCHVETPSFQAFKAYDEAGVGRRVQCLKYLVLANMLMESKVDPFDAQVRNDSYNTSHRRSCSTANAAHGYRWGH